ncbi:MAG TPA: hypothetical protein VGN57_04940 [Pirellulaceae bacterium]|jgi:hypothetical protein|nr:hypothetical protein [Pirellulaceae bacterium]
MARTNATAAFTKSLKSLLPKKKGDEHAEALLLTCIDFRFFGLIAQHMESMGFDGKYDHFILAGAALGACLDFNDAHLPAPIPPERQCEPFLPRLHWQQVFLEHLQIATDLHATIDRVIIIEHRDCGAYKVFKQPGGYATPAEELAAHKEQAEKLEQIIQRHAPHLTVEKYLASLKPNAVGPLEKGRLRTFNDLKLELL